MLCGQNGEFQQDVLFTGGEYLKFVSEVAAPKASVELSLLIYNNWFLWANSPRLQVTLDSF